jgi:hypothetical protein
MADEHLVYEICGVCHGVGEVGESVYVPPDGAGEGESDGIVMKDCTLCEGTGKVVFGELSGDLVDFLSDMDDKLDEILEKVSE